MNLKQGKRPVFGDSAVICESLLEGNTRLDRLVPGNSFVSNAPS